MQPTKKGTKVYTRVHPSTGREIIVRKRRETFTVYVDNQETDEYPTQQAAMQAANRLAEADGILRIVPG